MSSLKLEPVKLNLLLIGKTGQGKSSTGNTLINRPCFGTSSHSQSHTKDVKSSYSIFENYILMVVDGPGLDDTAMTQDEDRATFAECMTSAIALCSEGVDAFILVIRFPIRFTDEERSIFHSLKKIFGDQFINHVIVVVTCGDIFYAEFEENPIGFNDWCKRQVGTFKDLYKDCSGRFVLFNNREKDENKKRSQVKQVVQLVHSLQKTTGRYTSKCFDDAKIQRDRLILELKAPHLRLKFQEKIGLLTAAIEMFCKNREEDDKENIETSIEDLKKEIESEDQNYGVLDDLRDLVKKVEDNLNDVETLHNLTRQLETIREAKKLWASVGLASTAISGTVLAAVTPVGLAVGIAGAAITGIGYAALSVTADIIEKQKNEVRKKIKNKKPL